MNARFTFHPVSIEGVYKVVRSPIADSRGKFSRLFCADEFTSVGFPGPIAQINYSVTQNSGVVRGLHFQHPPHAEKKLVNCIKGKIFDVVVDLRSRSKTFLKWHGEVLSEDNATALFIPEGIAHGFQSLDRNCELIYFHSAPYAPQSESGLNPEDPQLGIAWPERISELSERDKSHPWIDQDFAGLDIS